MYSLIFGCSANKTPCRIGAMSHLGCAVYQCITAVSQVLGDVPRAPFRRQRAVLAGLHLLPEGGTKLVLRELNVGFLTSESQCVLNFIFEGGCPEADPLEHIFLLSCP